MTPLNLCIKRGIDSVLLLLANRKVKTLVDIVGCEGLGSKGVLLHSIVSVWSHLWQIKILEYYYLLIC